MRRVLLLGGAGAVGAGCLQTLTRGGDVSFVLAGRDEARLFAAASNSGAGSVEVTRLDIDDTAALRDAIAGCDVVANCAGPSQRYSATVGAAAVAAGVPYVDPGGDGLLVKRLTDCAPGVAVVLQTGVQPGLSGLLLRVLGQQRSLHAVTAWCGGLQRLTTASVLEYAASLRGVDGHPGAALRDGMIAPVGPDDLTAPPSQYFAGSAIARAHLDAETIAVAAYLQIRNMLWLNIFDAPNAARAMRRLAVGGADFGAVLSAAKLDLFGRRPYFAIVATADAGAATVALTCADSYRVTGALTAFAARHAGVMPAGVHPLWTYPEPYRILDFLTRTAEVSVLDETLVEEGSL